MENKENTGKSIQTLGTVVQVLGIIGSIIVAIICFVAAGDAYGSEEDILIGLGIGYLIGGIIASIISGIFIRGFGELVENSETTAAYSAISKEANTDTKKLVTEMNATLKSININLEKLGSPSVSTPANEVVGNTNTLSPIIAAMVEKLEDTTYVVVEGSKDTTEMWKCPKCGNFNFATSNECMNCHTKVKFK